MAGCLFPGLLIASNGRQAYPPLSDERQYWLRQFFFLFLVAAAIQASQAASGLLLARLAASPVLLAFGLDALVGAFRELALARRLARRKSVAPGAGRRAFSLVAAGYMAAGAVALVAGIAALWQGRHPAPTLTGVALAALSMLLVPIVGSYMKAVAMELRSPALRAASVFTFGNSYLSMVLLVSLLVRSGMERWWGDPLGALVMSPFILQKGIQILIEVRGPGPTGVFPEDTDGNEDDAAGTASLTGQRGEATPGADPATGATPEDPPIGRGSA